MHLPDVDTCHPCLSGGGKAGIGIFIHTAAGRHNLKATGRFQKNIRFRLVSLGILCSNETFKPVEDTELLQGPLDHLSRASRGNGHRQPSPMLSSNRQDRFHRNNAIEATKIGSLFIRDHFVDHRGNARLSDEHLDDYMDRNSAKAVKAVLREMKTKLVGRQGPGSVVQRHGVRKGAITVKNQGIVGCHGQMLGSMIIESCNGSVRNAPAQIAEQPVRDAREMPVHQMTKLAEYPGIDGFLGTRASLMLDVVFLAMFAVVPLMLLSVYLVRSRKQYRLHKQIQICLASVLAIAVILFEIDIRINGWILRAELSPYYGTMILNLSLWVHLLFAITTAVLWVYVVVQALRKIPNPPGPCSYSSKHIFWARLAVLDMILTALTGCLFYCLAFVAS